LSTNTQNWFWGSESELLTFGTRFGVPSRNSNTSYECRNSNRSVTLHTNR